MTVRLLVPRVVRRLWRYLCTTPVIEAIDPTPEYLASVARAHADQISERARCGVDSDGHALRHTGIGKIMAASQENNVINLAARKKALLAKSLIEECGQLTGSAFTFERREK